MKPATGPDAPRLPQEQWSEFAEGPERYESQEIEALQKRLERVTARADRNQGAWEACCTRFDIVEQERDTALAENARLRTAHLRIAFQLDGTSSLAGNPAKWPCTISYLALGGRFENGQRLDGRTVLEAKHD